MKVAFGSVPKDGGTFTFYRNIRPMLLTYGIEMYCVTVGRQEAGLVEVAYVDDGCVLLEENNSSVKQQAMAFVKWCEVESVDVVMAINSVAILSSLPHLPKHIRVVSRCANAFDEGYRVTMSCRERLVRVIALTPRLRDDLVASYDAEPSLIELIPNGIDPAPFAITGDKDQYVADAHSTVGGKSIGPHRKLEIGFLGRLEHKQKGVFDLPHIVAELKKLGIDFRLRIAGKGKHSGVLRAELEGYVASGEVEFLGALTKESVPPFLKSLDVYVFTSRFEGCPNALLEAMMAGCAPVAFLIDGITDFVLKHGKTGYVIPQGDFVGFASAIGSMASNPSLMSGVQSAALEDARVRFVPDVAAREYARVLREVMKAPLPEFEPLSWRQFSVDAVYRAGWKSYLPAWLRQTAKHVLSMPARR
jgi:glycosyltransferase involved in cell wall biosynthesis